MTTQDSHNPYDDSGSYWDKVVEVYKARLTVNIALLLAMVTLTGYSLQTARSSFFLLAGVIPLVTLVFDLLVKWHTVSPFLYKALVSEQSSADHESLTILFLAFGSRTWNRYTDIIHMPPGIVRQRAFRRAYVIRHLAVRLVFVLAATIIEIFLWLFSNR
jgi:hypothetical protein